MFLDFQLAHQLFVVVEPRFPVIGIGGNTFLASSCGRTDGGTLGSSMITNAIITEARIDEKQTIDFFYRTSGTSCPTAIATDTGLSDRESHDAYLLQESLPVIVLVRL
jgi:hypothetical protein